MKHVLILCDLFPPAFGPRMGYLCKYIQRHGWEPVVVTENMPACNFRFLEHVCEIHKVDFYTAKHPLLQKVKWLAIFLLSLLGLDYKDWKIGRRAERLIQTRHFDALLCSTYRTFPLPAAGKLTRKYDLPLIIDLRDIIEQYSGNEFITRKVPTIPGLRSLIIAAFRKRSLRTRNHILPQAACVTTVSDWHVNILRTYNPDTRLIYNGFDPEIFYPETIPTDCFIITYTGRLISKAMRDPSLLFESLRKLASDGTLTPKNCRVNWYVDSESWEIISSEAMRYGVSSFMEMKGYVESSTIPKVLNQSSVLLLLTNKADTQGPKGIMTTKLFESLAVEKPILCVRSDESYLAETIQELNAGLAATNTDEVYDFLLHYYKEWKEKGYTTVDIRRDKLARFSRAEQARQFARIFEQYS